MNGAENLCQLLIGWLAVWRMMLLFINPVSKNLALYRIFALVPRKNDKMTGQSEQFLSHLNFCQIIGYICFKIVGHPMPIWSFPFFSLFIHSKSMAHAV